MTALLTKLIIKKNNIMKVDLTKVKGEVFYKYIYPVFPTEFLYNCNYEKFAELVNMLFVLNKKQWESVLNEWEIKESLLTY